MLEEIFLHSYQAHKDGVATRIPRERFHIQYLKQKHGIDYDCHANYRFIEKADSANSKILAPPAFLELSNENTVNLHFPTLGDWLNLA
jgi:hypothetical protein